MHHQPWHFFAGERFSDEDADKPGREKPTKKELRARTPEFERRANRFAGDGDCRAEPEEIADEVILRKECQVVKPGLLATPDVMLPQPVEQGAVRCKS